MNAHKFVLVAFLHKQNANLPFKEKILFIITFYFCSFVSYDDTVTDSLCKISLRLGSTATLLSVVKQSD